MNVLHLFSNAKWTGPAEPVVSLCVALRGLGIAADLACSPNAGTSINKVVETARDRGIEPILRMSLSKHRNPVLNALDARTLAGLLTSRRYDVVHCHLDNDHRIALGPARRRSLPLVRSSYYGEGFPNARALAKLLGRTKLMDAWHIVEPSRRAFEHDAEVHGVPRERLSMVPVGVDTERFNPVRDTPDGRRWLGIPPGAFVVGIVARMQTHRRFEDLFRAVKQLVDAREDVHLVVVGRGTKQEDVGFRPVRELGLEDRVHFPGFIEGENYVGMLRSFDAKVFLVPGSDGTCRAVRECMAMARPAVVADRGMLAEIVDDGVNGIVCDGTPGALFESIRRLARDRALTRALGRAARDKVVAQFSLEVQGRAVADVYECLLRERPGSGAGSR